MQRPGHAQQYQSLGQEQLNRMNRRLFGEFSYNHRVAHVKGMERHGASGGRDPAREDS